MSNQPSEVPLNVWLLDGPDQRCALAERAIRTYSPDGGLVVDLRPGGFQSLAAASRSGRHSVAMGSGEKGDALTDCADLVLVLPGWPVSEASTLAERARCLLRPGAFLALGLEPRVEGDEVSAVVAAVADRGLLYFQHVVALDRVRATADGAIAGHVNVLVFRRQP